MALVFLMAFYALIRKGFGQFELHTRFRKKLNTLMLITALLQLIPNSVLLKYYHYECVLWNEHLTWQDFQAAPDTTSPYSARIATSLFCKVNQAYNYPQAVVWTAMNPQESWCVPNDKHGVYGRFLLDHEQLHFNITEVWRRRTSDSIAKVWGRTPEEMQAIIDYYSDQERNMQGQYDSLTHHGTDSLTQVQWRQLIKSRLRE